MPLSASTVGKHTNGCQNQPSNTVRQDSHLPVSIDNHMLRLLAHCRRRQPNSNQDSLCQAENKSVCPCTHCSLYGLQDSACSASNTVQVSACFSARVLLFFYSTTPAAADITMQACDQHQQARIGTTSWVTLVQASSAASMCHCRAWLLARLQLTVDPKYGSATDQNAEHCLLLLQPVTSRRR
jgi:hypothetical protein